MEPRGDDERAYDVLDIFRILLRRWPVLLASVAAALSLSLYLFRSRPKTYLATAQVLIEPKRPRFPGSDTSLGIVYYLFYRKELATQKLLIENRSVAKRVVEALGQAEGWPLEGSPDPAGALLGMYEAAPVGETRFIDILCRSTDPKWAAEIANAVADAYIKDTVARRRKVLNDTVEAYSELFPEQRAKLEEAEVKLLRFQEEHLVVSSDRPEETLRAHELDLLKDLSRARQERVSARARVMAHSEGSRIGAPHGDVALAAASSDARVRQLLDKRLGQRALLTELGKSFSEGHPKLESARTVLSEIERELGEASKSYYDRLQLGHKAALWKEREIARLLAEHRAQIASLRTKLTKYEALRQRRDSLRALQDPLARSQAELGLAAGLDLPNVNVEKRARPPAGPVGPSLPKYIVIGLLAGLVLGCGAAIVLEHVNESVRTPEDAARAAPVGMLGMVSVIRRRVAKDATRRARITAERSDSMFAEQFRSLRTGILSMAPKKDNGRPSPMPGAPAVAEAAVGGHPEGESLRFPPVPTLRGPKEIGIVLVTSPGLADGKTTVSFNTAEAFAQLGRPAGTSGRSGSDYRVVIVDADLRHPKGHEFMGVPREPGLVEVLEGDCDLEDAVRPCSTPNLFFLPAGRKTARPAELIASDGLRRVLERLRETYSAVWVDTPPVMAVADARSIAPAADLVLLVVRSARTGRRALQRTYELLGGGDGRRMMVVLNGVATSVAKGYGYRDRRYDRYYGSPKPSAVES